MYILKAAGMEVPNSSEPPLTVIVTRNRIWHPGDMLEGFVDVTQEYVIDRLAVSLEGHLLHCRNGGSTQSITIL